MPNRKTKDTQIFEQIRAAVAKADPRPDAQNAALVKRFQVLQEVPSLSRFGRKSSERAEEVVNVLKDGLPLHPGIDRTTLDELGEILPAAADVVEFLRMEWEFATALSSPFQLPNILLVGVSGGGKTHFAKQIQKLFCDREIVFAAAGVSSAVDVNGQPPGFDSADVGLAVRAMVDAKSANPVIIFDEIDKLGDSNYNGHTEQALLPLLERASAESYRDPFLGVPVNVSKVSYIFTANDMAGLSVPFLSRVRKFTIQGPRVEDLDMLVQSLRTSLISEYEIPESSVPQADDLLERQMINAIRRGASVRQLKTIYRNAMKRRLVEQAARRHDPNQAMDAPNVRSI